MFGSLIGLAAVVLLAALAVVLLTGTAALIVRFVLAAGVGVALALWRSPRVIGRALRGGFLAAMALSFAGCANLGANTLTAAQGLEAAETGGELLYVAIATTANSWAAVDASRAPQALALKQKAWADLGVVRQLYGQGQSLTAALAALSADQAATARTTGLPVVVPASAP